MRVDVAAAVSAHRLINRGLHSEAVGPGVIGSARILILSQLC